MDKFTVPTSDQLLKLLKKKGRRPSGNLDFVEAFQALYPTLTEVQRTELLQSILEYVDSLLAPQARKNAA